MLTGALQHCNDSVRVQKKTCVNLSLAGGMNLRYLDDRQMGKVYYIDNDEAREDSQEELTPNTPDWVPTFNPGSPSKSLTPV